MERRRLAPSVACVLVAVGGTGNAFLEADILAANVRLTAISVGVGLSLLCLPLAFVLWRRPVSAVANSLTGLVFALSTLWSQAFHPAYDWSFAQYSALYGFFFFAPPLFFRWFLTLWSLAFIACHWIVSSRISAVPNLGSLGNVTVSVTVSAAIAGLAYYFRSADRAFREVTMRRFAPLGLHAARLVHDLKGLVATPRFYMRLLDEKLGNHTDSSVVQGLKSLSEDFENMNRMIVELNGIASLRGTLSPATIAIDEAVKSVVTVLGHRVRGVKIVCDCDFMVCMDPGLLRSILLNLFINSLDAFRRPREEFPEIHLLGRRGSLTVLDNGGGFPPLALQRLNAGLWHASEDQGSALGLWFVIDGMKSIGGRARFRNDSHRACVDLSFPRRVVRPLSENLQEKA